MLIAASVCLCEFVVVWVDGGGSRWVGLYPQYYSLRHTCVPYINNSKLSGVQSFWRASCCHWCICSLITCPLWIHLKPCACNTTPRWGIQTRPAFPENTHTLMGTHKQKQADKYTHRGRQTHHYTHRQIHTRIQTHLHSSGKNKEIKLWKKPTERHTYLKTLTDINIPWQTWILIHTHTQRAAHSHAPHSSCWRAGESIKVRFNCSQLSVDV